MFKQIFIWWNQQTIGTRLYTIFFGKYVGRDNKGNKYHCPYPYVFNFKNSNTLCTKNNEYCNNVCCTSP